MKKSYIILIVVPVLVLYGFVYYNQNKGRFYLKNKYNIPFLSIRVDEPFYEYYAIIFEPLLSLEPGQKDDLFKYKSCNIIATYDYRSREWSDKYECEISSDEDYLDKYNIKSNNEIVE